MSEDKHSKDHGHLVLYLSDIVIIILIPKSYQLLWVFVGNSGENRYF